MLHVTYNIRQGGHMKKPLLIVLICLSFVGCEKANRLLGKEDVPESREVPVITSTPDLQSEAPEFNVTTPAGYTKRVIFGELIGNKVDVGTTGALVHVFIKDRPINRWFILDDEFSEAFWYSYEGNVVEYHGANLSLKEFCIYVYTLE